MRNSSRENPPQAILALARRRIAELLAVHQRAEQAWENRFVWGEMPRKAARFADLRWFSDCDVAAKTCGGQKLGQWLAGESQIFPSEPPSVEIEPDHSFINPIPTIIYNFAFNSEEDRCVIHEIDLQGNLQRAAYELPEGMDGPLGSVIGPVVTAQIKRGSFDACLPEDYAPRQRQPES